MQIKFEGGDAIKNPDLMPVIPYNGKGITTYGNVVIEDGIATGFDGNTSYLKADLGFNFNNLDGIMNTTQILWQVKYRIKDSKNPKYIIKCDNILSRYNIPSPSIEVSDGHTYNIYITNYNDYLRDHNFYQRIGTPFNTDWRILQVFMQKGKTSWGGDCVNGILKILDSNNTILSNVSHQISSYKGLGSTTYFLFNDSGVSHIDLNETFIKRLDTNEVLTQWIRK